MVRHHARVCAVVVLVSGLGVTGCVEPFAGSNLQMDFSEGVQTNPRPGATLNPGQPAVDSHYVFYASQLVYQTDGNGDPVLDGDGDPIVEQAYLYEVQRFEIHPVIDRTSPCFIDIEDTRYPGIHVTQYSTRLRRDLAVTDPYDPSVPRNDAIDVLTADQRNVNLAALERALKAVTSASDFRYSDLTAVGTQCVEDGGSSTEFPPITCDGDQSNAVRLSLCQEAWAREDAQGFYEGSDKVFTLPLNGKLFGMVEGMNPINDGFVGGSGMYVDEDLAGMDAYLINWQYGDLDHDGQPDYPSTVPADQQYPSGYTYLQGTPIHVTRGVINVEMYNLDSSQVSAQVAIFPNLGTDDVHF